MRADELRPQHPPQQPERRVRHAVGAGFTRLAVVVEHAAADVKDNAGKAFRHGKSAADLDIRADNLQQGGGKYIVGMELAAVGKAFRGDFHGEPPGGGRTVRGRVRWGFRIKRQNILRVLFYHTFGQFETGKTPKKVPRTPKLRANWWTQPVLWARMVPENQPKGALHMSVNFALIAVSVLVILVWIVMIGVGIYLLYLVIRALRAYIRSKEVRAEKKEICRTLGEQLRAERTRCKMTQEFVAETLGVSRQAVSKWENGVSLR